MTIYQSDQYLRPCSLAALAVTIAFAFASAASGARAVRLSGSQSSDFYSRCVVCVKKINIATVL